MANNDIEARINVVMNTDPAIKEATEAGEKIKEALSIKIKDPVLQDMQKGLRESYTLASKMRDEIKALVIDTKKVALSEADRAEYSRLYGQQERQTLEVKEAEATVDKQWARVSERRRVDPKGVTKWTENAERDYRNAQIAAAAANKELAITEQAMAKIEAKEINVSADFSKAQPEILKYNSAITNLIPTADKIISRNEFLANSVQAVAAAEASSMEEVEKARQATEQYGETKQAVGDIQINDSGWVQQTAADTSQAAENMKEVEEASRGMAEGLEESAKQGENEISKLLERIGELKKKIADIEAGRVFATPEEYIKLNAELRSAVSLLKDYRNGVDEAANSSKKMNVFTELMYKIKSSLRANLKDLGDFKKNITQIGNTIQSKLNSAVKSLRSHLNHLKRSLKHGLTNITKYVLGFRSLFFLVRRLRKGIKEGMENLAQYNDHLSKGVKSHNLFNDAMNDLQTHLLFLKNAWAAAFAPIVIKVMPILTGFIQYLAEAGNAVAKFIAELTGQDTAYNAVKVQAQDYADSLDSSSKSANKATKSAKKLQQQLASYDKLDVIKSKDDDDSSPSGGGGGGSNPYAPKVQDMFKTVLADTDGLADRIKKAFDENDFYGLGQDAAQAVKDGLDSIPWDTIQTKVGGAAAGFGQFVNGFLGNTGLWQSAGSTIGNAINTVTTAIDKFLDPIDSVLIGYNASEGLRKFLTTTNWSGMGSTIKKFFDKVTSGLQSFLNNFPEEETVDAIMDFINGLDIPSTVQTTLTILLTGIVNSVKLASVFLARVSNDIGLKLAGAVSEVHMDKYTLYDENGKPIDEVELPIKPTVDWTEHPFLALLFAGSDYHAKILIDVMTGGDYSKVQDLWNNWPEWLTFEGFGENVVTSFKALFEFDWLFGDGSAESGFLGARGIVTWFKEDVIGIEDLAAWWNSCFLSEWFGEMDKETGKIKKKSTSGGFMDMLMKGNSNSTGAAGGGGLMSAQMKSLIPSNDLLTKIQTGWATIKKFINDPIGTIREKVESAKKFINEKFNFENVKASVKEKWEGIKSKINEKLQPIRDKVESAKKFINEKFNFENVRKTVKEKWDKIKGYFVGDDSILAKIKKKFEDTKFKNPFEAITDAVESAKKAITGYDKAAGKTGILSTKKIHVKGLAERLADAFEGIVKALPTPIKDALKKVQDFINNLIDGINYLSGQLNKLKISGTNPFTGKSYSYGFSIPHIEHIKIPGLAQGAVIPPNKEFLAVLGDQKKGTNIETPLDTMVDAFKIALADTGSTNHDPIVLQLNSRVLAQAVWDEETKKYKQTGFGLAY